MDIIQKRSQGIPNIAGIIHQITYRVLEINAMLAAATISNFLLKVGNISPKENSMTDSRKQPPPLSACCLYQATLRNIQYHMLQNSQKHHKVQLLNNPKQIKSAQSEYQRLLRAKRIQEQALFIFTQKTANQTHQLKPAGVSAKQAR